MIENSSSHAYMSNVKSSILEKDRINLKQFIDSEESKIIDNNLSSIKEHIINALNKVNTP
jgi:hypothetical protein